ncbi:hypothetical protein TUM12370_19620 [Salmonella enterica subsp. enterica serovar Choleraesuis]|nr:hypothetical protein TUM12370_19620 [Salmonella enterica subsp. enterica serovar Choleraesuis]
MHKYGDNQFSAQISSRAWSDALANISAGKSDWLTLVPTLASALDSIKAQELRNSLYYALAPNARETLKILAILDNQKNRYQQGT